MEAKEFLKTVYWSEKEVNSLRNELRQVEATLLSSPSWSDMKVQTSGMQSTDDTYVQMMEIRERLMNQISHTVMMRDKASQMTYYGHGLRYTVYTGSGYLPSKRYSRRRP